MSAFALAAEKAQHLDRPVAEAAEPVRSESTLLSLPYRQVRLPFCLGYRHGGRVNHSPDDTIHFTPEFWDDRYRSATDPDGQPVTVRDTVLRAVRRP